MDVVSCTIESPASTGAWPYDPVWDDPSWEASIDGSVAGACCLNDDAATIKFTLNKDAAGYTVRLYRDTIGTSNQLLLQESGSSADKGMNSVSWTIHSEVADGYFAKAKAWGACGETDDGDEKKSSNVNVRRKSFFTCDTESITVGEMLEVWEMTDEVYGAFVAAGFAITVDVGLNYLLPGSGAYVKTVIIAADATAAGAAVLSGLTEAPAWMDENNATFEFPPWNLREWHWSASEYGYVGAVSLLSIYSSVTYDDVTPSQGDEPLEYSFINGWSWEAYSSPEEYESEFGLIPPEITIE